LSRRRFAAITFGVAWIVAALAFAAARQFRGGYTYVSPFAPGEAADQIAALRKKSGFPLRIVAVDLTARGTTVEVQNPSSPDVTDRWEIAHVRIGRRGLIDWTHVSGPYPVPSSRHELPVADLAFPSDQAEFGAVPQLAEAAVRRAALEEPAKVVGMHLGRQVVLLPYAHVGRLGWTVEVRSPRESARAFASAEGRITGADLQGTLRAKRLDLFRGGPPLLAIARQLSGAMEGKERIVRLLVYSKSLRAELVDPRDPRGRATYVSDIDGVFRSRLDDMSPKLPPALMLDPDPPFAVAEIDWSALPRMVETARERLAMRGANVALLAIRKHARGLDRPVIEWEVALTAASGQSASLALDTGGRVLSASRPPGQQSRPDMLQPAAAAEFVALLRRELDPQTGVMEIVLRPDQARATIRDPRDPRRVVALSYAGYVLEREPAFRGKPGTWMGQPFDDASFFRLAELDDAALAALPRLRSMALERLRLPGGRVETIGLGRHALILEKNRELVVEIDAKGSDGSGGRVFLDLRGRVLRTD